MNGKPVELLDHRRLIDELRRLQRRRGRTTKDSFDHPPRLSDDVANSVAGVSWLVLNDEDSAAGGFNGRYHVADNLLVPVPYEPVYIGSTLTSPWASVIAQNAQGDVQVLASFVTEAGGFAITSSSKSRRGFAIMRRLYFLTGRICAAVTMTAWIYYNFRLCTLLWKTS